MFSKAATNFLRCNVAVAGQQECGMATLKEISVRLKSVKNMQKITKSMKMVSAAKYAKAERELKPVRPYGQGAAVFYDKVECTPVASQPKQLIIAMSSDRGLCGGIHSSICKSIKADVAAVQDPHNVQIVCVGDKARAQLARVYPKNILFVVSEVGRKAPNYEDASAVANNILNSGCDFGAGKIVFNRFKSVVAYTTMSLPVFSAESVSAAEKYTLYDSLDAEVLQSYLEFSMASLLFYALKEGACSEQSARMTAMDSASKNAGEMIDKLTLTFNRTRQAVITGELIEIISGAAAL